jgi:hypothetical protein
VKLPVYTNYIILFQDELRGDPIIKEELKDEIKAQDHDVVWDR